MSELRDEISEWAEYLAAEAARRAIEGCGDPTPTLLAATGYEPQLAYEVTIALAQVAATVLRPDGHDGGPIGLVDARYSHERLAAQLLGSAAQGDVWQVAALARAALGPNLDNRQHARMTLGTMLYILKSQPIIRTPSGGTK